MNLVHAPRAGRDCRIYPLWKRPKYFNPRAPCGARQLVTRRRYAAYDISIHAPRAGRDNKVCSVQISGAISIHAPRAGRDIAICSIPPNRLHDFNPRAPCGARRRGGVRSAHAHCYFNPRAPCGARLSSASMISALPLFQSTRPVRGATKLCVDDIGVAVISIHAPRAGRDRGSCTEARPLRYFNPRAPCGARRNASAHRRGGTEFQSTRPVRGATDERKAFVATVKISIHAPRAGRDQPARLRRRAEHHHFNPRAPCGARRAGYRVEFRSDEFQSTRPVRGATKSETLPLVVHN